MDPRQLSVCGRAFGWGPNFTFRAQECYLSKIMRGRNPQGWAAPGRSPCLPQAEGPGATRPLSLLRRGPRSPPWFGQAWSGGLSFRCPGLRFLPQPGLWAGVYQGLFQAEHEGGTQQGGRKGSRAHPRVLGASLVVEAGVLAVDCRVRTGPDPGRAQRPGWGGG